TDISTLIGYSDVHGKLDVHAYMRGNISEPVITGKAKVTDAAVHGISFPEAKGNVKLSGWQLSFSDFMVRHKTGNFVLDGTIFFDGNGGTFDQPYFNASLSVRKVDVRGVIAIFYKDIPVNLNAEGEINFKGNTKEFKGDARLAIGAGDVYGQPVDKGFVTAELSEKGIRFPKVIAVRGNDVVTASGAIGFDDTFQGRVSSARFSLGSLKLLADTGAPINGSASFSVTGQGTFDNPSIDASLSTLKLNFGGVDLGAGKVEAKLRKDSLMLNGTVLNRKVSLAGSLGLSKPYKWNGRLVFSGGRFEPFLRLLYKGLPSDVSIVSTGAFRGGGELSNPSATSVQLDFSKVDALVLGRKLTNDGDIRIAYRGGKLDLKSFNIRGENLSLSATGVATGMNKVDARIRVDADLDALKPILKDNIDYISGRGQADIHVKGDLKNPAVSGMVRVTDAGLKVKDLPQRFDKINAEAHIDGTGFRLTKFGADFGGGTISARGDGNFKGWNIDSFGFDITANGIGVKTIEGLTPTVDASIRFEGVGGMMNASGNVLIRKARYAKRIDWKSWLVQIRRKRSLPAPSGSGGLKDISLDLHITAAETIKIDNNMAKVPVSADVYVRGTAGRPVLIGRLEAASGKVYFRNNEFKLRNAAMEFADPKKFNPLIDLTAETRVKDYTITLTLTGTLDRVKVDLVSDPPLEEGDVITLLALGRTSDELKGHEAAITTGEAAGFVTGQIQDAVESRVKMITGFDRFQIDPYMTSSGMSSGPRLTVGKSLFSDKLYLTYSSNIGTTDDQYVKLEYIFNKNLSLVGERDELGHYGGDLKFRFEFK
ncbi:MAG: translocation/assembly module TamB domain-containing protein, partial [Nitrospirota bacterium]